jgi:hypothetical protein
MTPSTVHIVHCIDTEGPLHEPLEATFERLRDIFGLDLPANRDTLEKLQRKEIALNGLENDVARVLSPELLAYHDTWEKLDEMLTHIMSSEYRSAMPDSFGGAWIYNWHCLDFVGFDTNPRRRDSGFHKVFDHYRDFVSRTGAPDGVHFHHHPIPFSGQGHHSATHYFAHAPMVFEILARRIIDRRWFPSVDRPGFHTRRPDSHWFMEQFIPFDYANQSTDEDYSSQKDIAAGRFGDWRRAPKSWRPYHPSHDDYQLEGHCRRWIARCLNIGSRVRVLTDDDIDLAFQEAGRGESVVLSFTHHDFRDMRPAVDHVRSQISRAAKRYPAVPFRYCEARDAMRRALNLPARAPLTFDLSLTDGLLTAATSAETFGPQPFLAIKRRDGRYHHDNLDVQVPFREWSYHLDEQTVIVSDVESIGMASADRFGNVTVAVMDPRSRETEQTFI